MARHQLKDYLRESHLFLNRAVIAAGLVVLLIALLAGRLVYLQVFGYAHYATLSQDNRVKLVPLPPTRGLIFDRQGVLLAQNRPAYSLEITPEEVDDMAGTLDALATIVTITPSDRERFARLRQQKRRFESIPIRSRLTPEEAAQFSVHRHRFPGVDIQAGLLRHYPQADKTAHVIGYVARISQRDLDNIDASNYAGSTHIGKIGIEKSYEDALHGQVGLQRVEINALGRVVNVLESSPPTPGKELTLHLDVRLQEIALAAFGERNGAAVAIDPNTGGVLALVSKPGFDPNPFVGGIGHAAYQALSKDPAKPLYNRALRGQYPPGSTVKPFIGLGGLERGVISFDSTTYCPGFYQLPGHSHRYRDWKKTGHGSMDIDQAIAQSCDVYFYDMAREMGVDALNDYLAEFGFGRRTGIDLIGELPGLLPSRDWKRRAKRLPWYPGETLIMGIGQGYFLTTPLQLATSTAALANGGLLLEPRLVSSVKTNEDGRIQPLSSTPRTIPMVSALNWEDIRRSMVHVVDGARGTAKHLADAGYPFAAKTGTAQVFTIAQDEEYNEDEIAPTMRDHALFVAYAPTDAPRIAVAVIVEHGGSGGTTAGPIARAIMDGYLLGETP